MGLEKASTKMNSIVSDYKVIDKKASGGKLTPEETLVFEKSHEKGMNNKINKIENVNDKPINPNGSFSWIS